MARSADNPIRAVQYTPPDGYALDVEVYRADELRRRAQAVPRGFERIDFYVVLYLTEGRYRHDLDFRTHELSAGSILVMQPGQVHRFGALDGWDGWLLIFRAEILGARATGSASPATDELDASRRAAGLPSHLQARGRARHVIAAALQRMAEDAGGPPSPTLNVLVRSELRTLLVRFSMLAAAASAADASSAAVERFRRFRAAVEREFRRWHDVGRYAKHLGCSEKSLGRATAEVADMGAKAFVTARRVLEAKRLLAHTLLPVAAVADELGFAEPTNFVKFFRRETGQTPGAFRRSTTGP